MRQWTLFGGVIQEHADHHSHGVFHLDHEDLLVVSDKYRAPAVSWDNTPNGDWQNVSLHPQNLEPNEQKASLRYHRFENQLRKDCTPSPLPLELGSSMPNRFVSACIFILCLFAIPTAIKADPSTNEVALQIENLRPDSEIIHYLEQNTWIGTNGVIVRYGDVVLTAETVRANDLTKVIIANGNVTLQREGTYWKGNHLEYNFEKNEIKASDFRAGMVPVFVSGVSLDTVTTNQVQEIHNASITTDDLVEPSFRIRAKKMKLTVGKSIEARDATIYVGNTPVLWLPYFYRNLRDHQRYFTFAPGYRNSFGAYSLNKYVYEFNDDLQFDMDLDYRSKRGVGFGPEFRYDLGRHGKGDIAFYQTYDRNPGVDLLNSPIPEDRHRFKFDYQVSLQTNLTAKVVVREQSDIYTIRDFFEQQYQTNSQPISFVEVNKLWSNLSLDILAQPQFNSFYTTVERLPDIRLSGMRQQLGQTPVFYESDSSFAYLRFRDGSKFGTNYAAARGDSYHQFLAPQSYWGWLNITPRIGGRLTHYGETDNKNLPFGDEDRFIFNTGAEASFKATRVWNGTKMPLLKIDGLRHILEPSLNYVFVPEPNTRPHQLPQFDTELPSLRLLPIDFPDYNQIDSIDSQNVMRVGLRNKFQTKRDGQVVDLLNWAIVTDLRLDPRENQSQFSDIYSDIHFMPRDWITFNSELRYDESEHRLNAANNSILLSPNDIWSIRLGQRYFRGDASFGPDSDNNTFYDTLYFKLNENWGFRMSHHFEARDGKMEDQYYTVYRDFKTWTGAFTLRLRDYRRGEDDFSVMFSLSFKAFASRYHQASQNESPLLFNK